MSQRCKCSSHRATRVLGLFRIVVAGEDKAAQDLVPVASRTVLMAS